MENMENSRELTGSAGAEPLTPRQIGILKKVGLPETLEALSDRQARSILEIEIMLRSLEEKYHVEFDYLGYSDGTREEKWLRACPKAGSPTEDVVLVTEEAPGLYVDDYPWICLRGRYSGCIAEAVREACGEGAQVKAFTGVGGTTLTDPSAASLESLSGKCHGSTAVFVCGVEAARLRPAAEALGTWMAEHGFYGFVQLRPVQTPEKLAWLSRFNYKELIPETETVICCAVSQDGTCRID